MGEPHLCSVNFAKPKSYFAVMLAAPAIIEKGVPSIRYDQSDGYYRCLLRLPAEKLKRMLADLAKEPRTDRFSKQLVIEDGGDELEPVSDEEVGEPPLPLPDLAIEAGLAPIIPQVAVSDSWARCIARHGGHEVLRVYFASASEASGAARGWSTCARHDCRRYRPCGNYPDRLQFVAEMALRKMQRTCQNAVRMQTTLATHHRSLMLRLFGQ